MSNFPLISIIIPMYNSSKFLKETLESIRRQIYTNWECIIIDDGSNDNSLNIAKELIEEDSRFQLYIRPDELTKGANTCRNYGFQKSQGEFINWFDSDDIMLENFLKVKVDAINNSIDLIITSGYSSNQNLDIRKPIDINNTNNLYKDFVLAKLKVLTPSILFRRSFLIDKEMFLEEIKRGQEAEFYSRLFFELPPSKFIILNQYLFLYRSHNHSISSFNKVYRDDFKESEAYVVYMNLERAYILMDNELIKSSFRLFINLLNKAIINKHQKNISYIFIILKDKFYKKNKVLIFFLFIIIKISRVIDLSFTKWDKIIKRFPIQF